MLIVDSVEGEEGAGTWNEPGVYRSVCVELELEGMAVAAILHSSLLDAPQQHPCLSAFSLFKALVARWIQEQASSEVAESLVRGLYRYLCGRGRGAGLLHDPALHRLVASLMKKCFQRFLKELRRLGLGVVYGDYHRVIVDTHKTSEAAARAHLSFVLAAILNQDLFQRLQVHQ